MTNPTPTRTDVETAFRRFVNADRVLATVKLDPKSTPRDTAAAAVNVASARARLKRLTAMRNRALIGR